MRKPLPIRPKQIRPMTRDHKPSYFQMHIYNQELTRLEAEHTELSKRINLIVERVQIIKDELMKIERALKE